MEHYFEEQLEFGDTKPISKEKLDKLKGRSLYSEYREGDVLLTFVEQEIGEPIMEEFHEISSPISYPQVQNKIVLRLQMIVKRDLDKLEEEFKFNRMMGIFPVFERKKNG